VASLSEKIKLKAAELGIDKIGFARAVELVEDRPRFLNWLELGYHGKMAWMEREPEKRVDPRVLFPEAKTVISLAVNYYTPAKHRNDAATGKISRYAWGDDYHDVVKEKIQALFDWIIEEDPTAVGKICVDTSPVMEKSWAVRAGVGWVGKNSNLITKDYGSWVFLGEILINLELDYDEPADDFCGTCTVCLEACPTGAITEERIVDSNKCISYATIELRSDEMPENVSSNLNGWLYGCDICQDVCPWNRFEQPTNETRFGPRLDETSLNLYVIESLTPDSYAARFRKSAMKRTKLDGLKRNARALRASKSPNP